MNVNQIGERAAFAQPYVAHLCQYEAKCNIELPTYHHVCCMFWLMIVVCGVSEYKEAYKCIGHRQKVCVEYIAGGYAICATHNYIIPYLGLCATNRLSIPLLLLLHFLTTMFNARFGAVRSPTNEMRASKRM